MRINVRELTGHVERVTNENQGLYRSHNSGIIGRLGQHSQSENGALQINEKAVFLIWAVLDTLTEGFGQPHGPGGDVLSRRGRIWYRLADTPRDCIKSVLDHVIEHQRHALGLTSPTGVDEL